MFSAIAGSGKEFLDGTELSRDQDQPNFFEDFCGLFVFVC
jgi:hypothetical protein